MRNRRLSETNGSFIIQAIVCLALFSGARADQIERTGSLYGTILDAVTREPIAGVSVQLVGTKIGAATDLSGSFKIENIPIGEYAVRASTVGYKSQVKTDVVVSGARPKEIDFVLSQAAVDMGKIVVHPNFFSKPADAPMSTHEQTAEEIRRLPGGLEDVVRAVSVFPGVQQVDQGRNDLVVRGGAPSENLFVVDNLEIPNINHYGSQGLTGGPMSFINLDLVQGTSFSTGGFGVRYGDKLSSVLNIDLRDGRKDRFGGKATVSAMQFGLNLEGPIEEKGSYLFSARRSYLDWLLKAAGFSFVPEFWDFLGKASYRIDHKNSLNILGIAALDNVKRLENTAKQRFENTREFWNKQDRIVGALSWQHLFGTGYSTVTLGQTFTKFYYLQKDSLLSTIFKNDSYEYESSLRGDLVFQFFKSTTLSGGLQGKLVNFRSDMFIPPMTTSFGNEISVDALYDTVGFKGSGYIQIAQTIGHLNVTAGGRFDYFDLIKNKMVAAPRFSAVYSINSTMNFCASAGRYYQAPSYIWLVANPQNRNLNHVGVDQIIVGIDRAIRHDTKISLEAYTKTYFDYPASMTQAFLVLANTGVGFGGKEEGFASFGLDPLCSEGDGWAKGIELLIQKKHSEVPCYGIVSVSYNRVWFRGLDGVKKYGSNDQRWIVNLSGGFIPNEKWEFTSKFRYSTGIPYTPFNPDGTQTPGLYNSARLRANHSLDVRADRRWNMRSRAIIAFVDIQNVYNNDINEPPEYNERTQSVEWDHPIGIMPSIGVSLEF